jgi:hypothetical protein
VRAPPELVGLLAEAGLHRVVRDVAEDRPHLGVARHGVAAVPALEDVARPAQPPVELLRVPAVQPPDAAAEVRAPRLDQQVHVVGHQAVREAAPVAVRRDEGEQLQVADVVAVAEEQPAPIVPPGEHVRDPGLHLHPRLPWHATTTPRPRRTRPPAPGGQSPPPTPPTEGTVPTVLPPREGTVPPSGDRAARAERRRRLRFSKPAPGTVPGRRRGDCPPRGSGGLSPCASVP